METKKTRVMLVSLGGSPAPVIESLNKQQPDYICFLVSEQTRDSIPKDILPKLNFKYIHHNWIMTPVAEGLSETFEAIYDNLDQILNKWGVKPEELTVDYTGGTKTMSVASVLATIDKVSKYSYVGGTERTKEGVGIVVDGKEKVLFSDNPWDQMAILAKREINLLFNKARYPSAIETIEKTLPKLSGNNKTKTLFELFKNLIEGYDLWDRFQHKKAMEKINTRLLDRLRAYAVGANDSQIDELVRMVQENAEFLNALDKKKLQQAYYKCLDLISNARRRADLEEKYDDAVARLYRAMEAFAQAKLKAQYNIDTGNADIEKMPQCLREEHKNKYTDEKGKIKVPLFASYRLLKELGDELGVRFITCYEDKLRSLLNSRNDSILAHGFNSINREAYQKLYEAVMEFTLTEENILPRFPVLNL